MAFEDFTGREVSPGEPVTAQAWNELVRAIGDLVAFAQATTGTRLEVTIGNTDIDPARTRVSAIGASGAVVDAARPVPPGTSFIFGNLFPGPYTIRAEAPGFSPQTTNATIPSTSPISLTLQRTAPAMPQLFGRELRDALADLAARSIVVARVVDVTGRDIAPANPDAEFASAPVLEQLPEPGEVVASGAGAQLVVAASLKVEPSIEMPSLTGLTLDEVRRVLSDLGLVLGNVRTQQ